MSITAYQAVRDPPMGVPTAPVFTRTTRLDGSGWLPECAPTPSSYPVQNVLPPLSDERVDGAVEPLSPAMNHVIGRLTAHEGRQCIELQAANRDVEVRRHRIPGAVGACDGEAGIRPLQLV